MNSRGNALLHINQALLSDASSFHALLLDFGTLCSAARAKHRNKMKPVLQKIAFAEAHGRKGRFKANALLCPALFVRIRQESDEMGSILCS